MRSLRRSSFFPFYLPIGILCHADIVAREMKKPCVVGTQFATKLFHDGDLVEVDAEKGVVRKISPQSL